MTRYSVYLISPVVRHLLLLLLPQGITRFAIASRPLQSRPSTSAPASAASTCGGAAAFCAADIDGNKSLDFDEFIEIVPDAMKKDLNNAQLKELFDSVDTDGSGDISMDEFFLWTMSVVAHHTGSGIEAIFRSYDATGEGMLDPAEFAAACEDLGFGAMAPP